MDRKEISKTLKDMQISPSLLNWDDNKIQCTEIWYDEEANELCADCGVSVPVGDTLDLAKILIDLEDAIITHYKKRGDSLSHSYI